MTNVIDMTTRTAIDTAKITRQRLGGKAAILPRTRKKNVELETVEEHHSEPIKSLEDINRICTYLLDNGRYRDYMLFVIGINLGLRTNDLVRLRFCHLLNDDLTFKESLDMIESKTSKSRSKQTNRHLVLNDAVMDAVEIYLTHTEGVHLDDLLFHSASNRGKNVDKGLTTTSVYRIMKGIQEELNIPCRMGAHTLRKTFAYHQMAMTHHDPRKLLLLQKMFGHSDTKVTMRYIGLTNEEMEDAYLNLNLGGQDYSSSPVKETSILVGNA
jgi:integrase